MAGGTHHVGTTSARMQGSHAVGVLAPAVVAVLARALVLPLVAAFRVCLRGDARAIDDARCSGHVADTAPYAQHDHCHHYGRRPTAEGSDHSLNRVVEVGHRVGSAARVYEGDTASRN